MRRGASDASGKLVGSGSGLGVESEVLAVGRVTVCSKRPVDVDAAAK